jgi:hypothetical protein
MDDYSLESITESKNEWSARLVSTVSPLIVDGFKSIYAEADKLCVENDEEEKVLMTFQNLISRIPKWSSAIITEEAKRIRDESKCEFLEEMITCVHIAHLKALTVVRVGQKQKRIDIDIPALDKFVHNTYICCARSIYKNVYLLDANVAPLTFQKHDRELEIIVKEGVLESIRNSVPIDAILRAYIEKTEEDDVLEPSETVDAQNVKTEDGVRDIATAPVVATTAPSITAPSITTPTITAPPTTTTAPSITTTAPITAPPTSDVQFSEVVDTKIIPSVKAVEDTITIGPDIELNEIDIGAISLDPITKPSSGAPIELDIEELVPAASGLGNKISKPVAIDLSKEIERLA